MACDTIVVDENNAWRAKFNNKAMWCIDGA